MLKELWTLILMLFSSKPKNIHKVELKTMNHFPFNGYSYMMWCGSVICRENEYIINNKVSEIIVNHETIHLMQAKKYGSWIKYYWNYLIEWIKGNPLFGGTLRAYLTIPFECEAYANEYDFGYCKDYDNQNLEKYRFKNRSKLYMKVGGTEKSWVEYIKNIK